MTRALASPFGILIVFPSIVLAVGLFLTLVGQSALKGSNLSLGERRLGDQVKLVASHLRGALEQADPMLDRASCVTTSLRTCARCCSRPTVPCWLFRRGSSASCSSRCSKITRSAIAT